jgi:uncharacterized membrane protein
MPIDRSRNGRVLACGLAFAATLSIGVEGAQKSLVSFDVPGEDACPTAPLKPTCVVATRPFKVSPNGVVVGLYIDAGNLVHGFRMSGGTYERIDGPGLPGGQPGGARRTNALGINPRGDIVGQYVDTTGRGHGYLLRNGVFTTIDVPDSSVTVAAGIAPNGDIVGRFNDAALPRARHGFLLRDGVFTTIDVPGAILTEVDDINASGDIVGHYRSADGKDHAFLLSHGVFTSIDVDVPGALGTGCVVGCVSGINPRGQVAGWYTAEDGSLHGFIWEAGVFEYFDVPDATRTCPFGINAAGWVVGSYNDAAGEHGFLTRM